MRVATALLGCLAGICSAEGATVVASDVDLIPGVFVAGTQPDGNTVIFKGADGLVVFDTGRHHEHTQKIIDFAVASKQPVAAIVNSHWHLDHVGGNVLLKKTYPNAHVYASAAIEGAMHGFLASYHAQLEDAIRQAGDDAAKQAPWRAELALIDSGSVLYPDVRISETTAQTIAGRKFTVGFESHAVTAGDVWLFDPATRVLASGDLVTLPAPLFDTACAERWRAALDWLDAVDFKILVPGHGAPMRRKEFATYRHSFDHLLECAAGKATKQTCIDGWMNDMSALIPSGDQQLARTLLDYYIDGNLRGSAPQKNKLCSA